MIEVGQIYEIIGGIAYKYVKIIRIDEENSKHIMAFAKEDFIFEGLTPISFGILEEEVSSKRAIILLEDKKNNIEKENFVESNRLSLVDGD